MKIFFVCHRFPYPPNRGGKIRPFNMIRHLSENHEVIVASLAHTQRELDDGAGLKEYCTEVYADVLPEKLRWAQAAWALPSVAPSSVAYFRSSRLHQKIRNGARKHCFDAVVVHCAFAAQYAVGIPSKFRVLDYGDLDSGKWFDYQKFRGFPLCYGYGIEARKLRRYEKQLAQSFDYCTVTTRGELEEFKKLDATVPSMVIPNGVDNGYFQLNSKAHNGHVIVFVGRMDYFPNIDGAEYFARQILPIIRCRFPDATLQLVGSDPTQAVRGLAMVPGVTVTGHVPDVRPYVLDATVTVAPLRLARGTQNKILESMAMGIPVVATAAAAKGVAAIAGQHLLVSDEPNEFAAEVIRIFEDQSLRKSLSESARRQVKEAHSWPRSMQILDELLDRARLLSERRA
jgi:sugar transferase (PEP-CTERM/EpsH1 system associated)